MAISKQYLIQDGEGNVFGDSSKESAIKRAKELVVPASEPVLVFELFKAYEADEPKAIEVEIMRG